MVGEIRAQHADYDARRHFTPAKQQITDARAQIAAWSDAASPRPEAAVARTAASFTTAAAHDLEVG
jgi:hypothetical protein